MKILIILLFVLLLTSCVESSIDVLNKLESPVIVYSKHEQLKWFDDKPNMVVKTSDGTLVSLPFDVQIKSLIKYEIGDTIK